ncbi:hypothetical protein [Piscirickettsia litoralis]|uniref:hypothetical protein n=1 Tax=Piscirickettsia litoralis TaxID=1891921 RepID=UPI001F1FDDFD|nr:hypothetical protein [Piscirickettsia litoralis]
MRNNHNTIYCITNLQGVITFASRSFLELHNINQEETIGSRVSQYITFPLGCTQAIQDIIDIGNGKIASSHREGIILNQDSFAVGTLHKYPQMNDGKIIGIVHETDCSLEQLINNKCLEVIEKASYKGEVLNKIDIKLLMILTQFNNLKADDIASIFNVKTSSVYVYKNSLISKIRSANHSEDFLLP